MHTTFYLLLIRSRSLGSSFWLPLAILSSAILALLIALPIAMAIKIPIDPVALTEALPFLVCTVGFDKPLRLARAVFLHPHLSVPPSLVPASSNVSGYPTATTAPAPNNLLSAPASSSQNLTLKPAPKIITESLSLVYAPIIRDYILEVAVLTVGAYSKVGGLKEVCALAALILAIDCLLLCTYLAAILGIMVEVSLVSFLHMISFVIRLLFFFSFTLDLASRLTAFVDHLSYEPASCFLLFSESLGHGHCHRWTSHATSDISCALTFGVFLLFERSVSMSKFGRTSPGDRVDEGGGTGTLLGGRNLMAMSHRGTSPLPGSLIHILCFCLLSLLSLLLTFGSILGSPYQDCPRHDTQSFQLDLLNRVVINSNFQQSPAECHGPSSDATTSKDYQRTGKVHITWRREG